MSADNSVPAASATPAPKEALPSTAPEEEAVPASVLARMLARGGETSGDFLEATIATWSGQSGTLENGRMAGLAASCLLRPAPGDRALVWSRQIAPESGATSTCWVLGILERPSDAAAVLSTSVPLAIEAPKVGIAAGAVHVAAEDYISSVRNHHAVEDTRTETVRLRVADIGTDVRRASTAVDEVSGTMLQRAGTWISNTVREARFRARTFLFD